MIRTSSSGVAPARKPVPPIFRGGDPGMTQNSPVIPGGSFTRRGACSLNSASM